MVLGAADDANAEPGDGVDAVDGAAAGGPAASKSEGN